MPFKPYVTRTIRRLQEAAGNVPAPVLNEARKQFAHVIVHHGGGENAHAADVLHRQIHGQDGHTAATPHKTEGGVVTAHVYHSQGVQKSKAFHAAAAAKFGAHNVHHARLKGPGEFVAESVQVDEDGGPANGPKILARALEKQTSEVPDSKGPLPLPHTIAPEPETPKARTVENKTPEGTEKIEESADADVSHPMYHKPHALSDNKTVTASHGHLFHHSTAALKAAAPHLTPADHLRHSKAHYKAQQSHDAAFSKASASGQKDVAAHHTTMANQHRHLSIVHAHAGGHVPPHFQESVDTGISFADRIRHAAAGTRPQLVLDIKADPTVTGTEIGEASAAFADIIDPESLTVESLSADDHVVHVKYHLRSTEQAKKTVHHLVGAALNHGSHGHDAEGYDGDVKFHFRHHDAAKHFANHAKAVAHVHTVAHAKPDEATDTYRLVPYDQVVLAFHRDGISEARVMLTQDMGQASPQLDILLAQFGGKMSEGGYEFQEPSKAQSFLNMYMVHGGRGYIRVPKSKDNPDGKAGPNESADIDEVPGTFLSRVLNAAVNESEYHALVAARDHAEAAHKATSAHMHAYPRLPNGLIPDHVKATPEYKKHRAEHDAAFAHLRHINHLLVKHPEHRGARPGMRKRESVDEAPPALEARTHVTYTSAHVMHQKADYPDHLSNARHAELEHASNHAHRLAKEMEDHAARHGHLHPSLHDAAKAARHAAGEAFSAYNSHMAARAEHRAKHEAVVDEAKLPGVRVTDHEHVKTGDHVAWHGPLNGRTGTGPRVMHHGEVTHFSDAPQRMGKIVHVKVHTINGKPAHEHLDGDRVYKDVPHEKRHNVLHHEIHHSRFSPHDNPIHKV